MSDRYRGKRVKADSFFEGLLRPDTKVHTAEFLRELQSLPLERKVNITISRIIEFVQAAGGAERVAVSYSGGKDSTVLLHIARQLFPDIKVVYSDTGLEYPEVRAMAKLSGADIVRPKMSFPEVVTRYGYPLVSKEVAGAIYYARRVRSEFNRNKSTEWTRKAFNGERMWQESGGRRRALLMGVIGIDNNDLTSCSDAERKTEKISMYNKEKWLPMVQMPFRIGSNCCAVMKKGVLHEYQSKNHVVPMVGTLAAESLSRKQAWIMTGCNAFAGAKSKSQPLSFWTEQDILAYLVMYDLPIATVYGDIIYEDKSGLEYKATADMFMPGLVKLKTSGVERTGCMFCGFGFHLDKGETRFQRLKRTHPKQYEYCIGGGQWIDNPDYVQDCPEYDGAWKNWNPERIWVPSKEGLGFGKVFDMCNEVYGDDFYRYK